MGAAIFSSRHSERSPILRAHGDEKGVQHDLGGASTTFHFDGRVEGVSYPSLSPPQQDQFKVDFCGEIANLKRWAARENWPECFPSADLRVFVSDEYKISRALLPASIGQRGRMEFPAWKVVAGEAAITHELVHVYFPNGNRFLAEGLAVYLQATIGGNPAFPNFGRPLHEVTRELLHTMVPEFTGANPGSAAEHPARLSGQDRDPESPHTPSWT